MRHQRTSAEDRASQELASVIKILTLKYRQNLLVRADSTIRRPSRPGHGIVVVLDKLKHCKVLRLLGKPIRSLRSKFLFMNFHRSDQSPIRPTGSPHVDRLT